jgi:hypothetical protein
MDHPDEVREAFEQAGSDAMQVFCFRTQLFRPFTTPPASLVKAIADSFPQCLSMRDGNGRVALHYAAAAAHEPLVKDFFRAVFHGDPTQLMVRDRNGISPLNHLHLQGASLFLCWDLLRKCPEAMTTPNDNGVMPFYRFVWDREESSEYWATVLLWKMAFYLGRVPKLPSNEAAIEPLKSHPSIEIIANRLMRDANDYIVHAALAANCPLILFDMLVEMFPEKLHMQNQSRKVPLELAMLNLARDSTLEQIQIVYHLLHSKPDYLLKKEAA